MTPEAMVSTRLLADAQVATLVNDRVYGLRLPQDPAYPSISLFLVDGVGGYALGTADGPGTERVQIDIWGDDSALANVVTLRDVIGKREGIFDGSGGVFVDRKRGPVWDEDGLCHHAIVEILVRRNET